MTSDNVRRLVAARDDLQCSELSQLLGDETIAKIFAEVCRASRLGIPLTIWDLPQLTGLPLPLAFATVRSLEFGRYIVIDDNPSDPFGATLGLFPTAIQRLMDRRAA